MIESKDLDPVAFHDLMQQIYDSISPGNEITIRFIIQLLRSHYYATDVKAAILALKAEGKISLDNDGIIRRNTIWT